MTVLVVYASAHGSTREVAERVAARLHVKGLQALVQPVESPGDWSTCEAVVLGSAIHGGRWLPSAEAFVAEHRALLNDRRVWLFSVASIGTTSSAVGAVATWVLRRLGPVPRNLGALKRTVRAEDHRAFAGVLQPERWGRAGTVFLRVTGGGYGDYRDWADIDAWADTIATHLLAGPVTPADSAR